MISKFSNFALTRNQLTMVKGGGFTCSITATFDGGGQIYQSGACSGNSVEQCNGYAQQNCAGIMEGSSGTCTVACMAD